MKITYSLLSISLLSFFLFLLACQQENTSNTAFIGEKIAPTAFAAKLAATQNPQLIDVRTAEEFQEGAIEKAINYDFYQSNFETNLQKLDKERPVFIYCKSGGRSKKTLVKLVGLSFKEVYDLEGGYTAWKNKIIKQ